MSENLIPNSEDPGQPNGGPASVENLELQADGRLIADVSPEASLLASEPQGFLQKSIDWILENCSSIFIKEARQSLKSYQFFGTYILLIIAVIAWSAIALALGFYANNRALSEDFASGLLCGFLIILGLPLFVIVPFSAFRSLMREYEDGTIQLISITTMKPYQIVIGKLATAMLQMAIYLSVVAPCIAFISMLDGVTYVQILYGLGIVTYSCFILTVFGLLLAGASRSYGIGLATSTMFVLGLGGLYVGWWNFVTEVIFESSNLNNPDATETAVVAYFLIAFSLCTTLLALAAAASQISFPTDNRSTWIRIVMFLQLPFFLGGVVMLAPVFGNGFSSMIVPWCVFLGHYWLLMGSLLVGESGEMSRRIFRGMPKSGLGKTFFSLLMPGPGRGYLFALACMVSCVVVVLLLQAKWELFSTEWGKELMLRGMPAASEGLIISFFKAMVVMSYPCLFLSVTYLVMEMLRRFSRFRLSGAGGPVVSLVVALATFFLITMTSIGLTDWGYSYSTSFPSDMAATWNWYLNVSMLIRINQIAWDDYLMQSTLYLPLVFFSYAITFLGIMVASRELKYQPMATPKRVEEDIEQERELAQQEKLAPGESIDEIFGSTDTDTDIESD